MNEDKEENKKESKDPNVVNFSNQKTKKRHIEFKYDKENSTIITSKLIIFLTIIEGLCLIIFVGLILCQ